MKKRMTLIVVVGMSFASTALAEVSAKGQLNKVSDYQVESMACHGKTRNEKTAVAAVQVKKPGKAAATRVN